MLSFNQTVTRKQVLSLEKVQAAILDWKSRAMAQKAYDREGGAGLAAADKAKEPRASPVSSLAYFIRIKEWRQRIAARWSGKLYCEDAKSAGGRSALHLCVLFS